MTLLDEIKRQQEEADDDIETTIEQDLFESDR